MIRARGFVLLPLAAALAAGGCGSSGKPLTPDERNQLLTGALQQEPGSKLVTMKCGSRSAGCTVYVRKGASRRCDGFLAQFDSTGTVAVIGVGNKSC